MEIFTFFLKAIRHLQSFVSLSGLDLSEYGSYLFLGLLLLVLLPAVILGILQIRSRVFGALASVGMSMSSLFISASCASRSVEPWANEFPCLTK